MIFIYHSFFNDAFFKEHANVERAPWEDEFDERIRSEQARLAKPREDQRGHTARRSDYRRDRSRSDDRSRSHGHRRDRSRSRDRDHRDHRDRSRSPDRSYSHRRDRRDRPQSRHRCRPRSYDRRDNRDRTCSLKREVPCVKCGELGHYLGDCKGPRCFTCGEQGHFAAKCPKQAPEKRTKSVTLYKACKNALKRKGEDRMETDEPPSWKAERESLQAEHESLRKELATVQAQLESMQASTTKEIAESASVMQTSSTDDYPGKARGVAVAEAIETEEQPVAIKREDLSDDSDAQEAVVGGTEWDDVPFVPLKVDEEFSS